jgi:hypothetical protein
MRHPASLRRLPHVERLEARDNPSNFLAGLLGIAALATYYAAGAVESAFAHHSTPKPSVTYSRKFLLAHGVVLPPTAKPRLAYSREFLLTHGVILPHRTALHDMHRTALHDAHTTALQPTALHAMHATVLQPTVLQPTALQAMHTTALQQRTA